MYTVDQACVRLYVWCGVVWSIGHPMERYIYSHIKSLILKHSIIYILYIWIC
jgi:hypothetical protein